MIMQPIYGVVIRTFARKCGAKMEDIVIISGCRTAIGTFGGSLSETSASDLGAHVIRESVKRAGIEPNLVDQVVLG